MNNGNEVKAGGASPQIGFLFNHDQIHQIGHSLPVAVKLAIAMPGARISVAVTNRRIANEVNRLLGSDLPANIELVELSVDCR